MNLIVTTPTAVVVDITDVRHIRAEDRTGAFGIEPGHADFVTLLPVSVISWTDASAREGFVLVRKGTLCVHGGDQVEIAVRGAYREDDLAELGRRAIEALEKADESEDIARTSDTLLHLATMRQIERVLKAGRDGGSAPPLLDRRGKPDAPR
jgi:F-type H+-transporting ATPase subunit epsilon